jgi:hypothetical protein
MIISKLSKNVYKLNGFYAFTTGFSKGIAAEDCINIARLGGFECSVNLLNKEF